MHKVWYGPPSNLRPYVPSTLILPSTGPTHKSMTIGDGAINFSTLTPEQVDEMVKDGSLDQLEIEAFDPDKWIVLEEDRVDQILVIDLVEWKEKRSREIAEEVKSIRGDPLRTLKLVKAAANLRSFSLSELLEDLRSRRESDDEGPAQVFSRVRGNPPEGQTS